jgi:hypothetical protein
VDEFKIGVAVMNPPIRWDLDEREKWIKENDATLPAVDKTPNDHVIDGLDQYVIPYGEESPEGIIKVNVEKSKLKWYKPFDDSHLRSGATSDGRPLSAPKPATATRSVSGAEVMMKSVSNEPDLNVVDVAGNVNLANMMNEWIVRGDINATATTTTVPAPAIDWTTRKAPEYHHNRVWYRTAYNELAIGKKILITPKHEGLDKIPKAFYQSRSELVNIINERITLITQNRSYPHKQYSDLLVGPFLYSRDSGIVTVVCGFNDHFNSTYTPYTYLTPVIYSERVLKFLGFDRTNWKFDAIIKGWIYTVPPGKKYNRRDATNQLTLPVAPQQGKVYEDHAAGDQIFRDIFIAETTDPREVGRLQFIWLNFEKDMLITHWAEKKMQLLKPKLLKPQFLYLYCDIASPSHIGNMRASVLRITSLKTRAEDTGLNAGRLYQNDPEKFVHILRAPVSRKSFNSITIFLSDEFGSQLIFDEGTVYVVLEFRKEWDNSYIQ